MNRILVECRSECLKLSHEMTNSFLSNPCFQLMVPTCIFKRKRFDYGHFLSNPSLIAVSYIHQQFNHKPCRESGNTHKPFLGCNVFRDRELVNYFIRGLLSATRDTVTERVRTLNPTERGDLTVAQRVATAEGNTYRARGMTSTPTTPSKNRPRTSTLLTGEPEASPNPSPFRRNPDMPHMFAGPDQYWARLKARDPEHAHTIVCQLESLLFASADDGESKVPMSPTDTDQSFADPVLQRP